MKVQRKWIMTIILMFILSATTYWSLTYASQEQSTPQVGKEEAEEQSGEMDIPVTEMEVNNSNTPVYIEEMFFSDGIGIGDEKEHLFHELGEPLDSGMYNGGYYFAYQTVTYFVNPDTDRINAMAYPGEELDRNRWEYVEAELADDLKFAGHNEMDQLWMEIYDWEVYDIMIERYGEEEPPFYIWIMEDNLFLHNS